MVNSSCKAGELNTVAIVFANSPKLVKFTFVSGLALISSNVVVILNSPVNEYVGVTGLIPVNNIFLKFTNELDESVNDFDLVFKLNVTGVNTYETSVIVDAGTPNVSAIASIIDCSSCVDIVNTPFSSIGFVTPPKDTVKFISIDALGSDITKFDIFMSFMRSGTLTTRVIALGVKVVVCE